MTDLPLLQGESVLWQSRTAMETEAPKRLADSRRAKAFNLVLGIINLAASAYFIYDLLTAKREFIGTAIIIGLGTLFAVSAASAFKSAYSTRIRPRLPGAMQQTAFRCCVITDRRVLLFNHPADTLTALDRRTLTSATKDFAQGSPALVFRSEDHADSYAWLANEPRDPVLRVLNDHPLQ